MATSTKTKPHVNQTMKAYHSSPSINRESILRKGLRASKPGNQNHWPTTVSSQPSGVYMHFSLEECRSWPDYKTRGPYLVCDTFDIFSVVIDEEEWDFDPCSASAVYCYKKICPERIELVEKDIVWKKSEDEEEDRWSNWTPDYTWDL